MAKIAAAHIAVARWSDAVARWIAREHGPLPDWCAVELANALVPGEKLTIAAFRHSPGDDAIPEDIEAQLDDRRQALAFVASRVRDLPQNHPHARLIMVAFRRTLLG